MLLTILVLCHLSLITFVTLRVLSRNDLTSSGRLAWFIVVLLFPYIGVLIYWVFGEIYLGKQLTQEYADIMSKLYAYNPELLGHANENLQAVAPLYQAGFQYANSVTNFPVTLNNHATLMPDAKTAREQMIIDFDNATDHIHVLYYIWLDDETGVNTAKALIRASKRGVSCRAIVDGLGSRKLIGSPLWREMKEAGVELSVALPISNIIKVLLFSRIDLRNHRKITIIDGRITYCGSQNCADPEFRVKAKYAPWIDIMMRFEGAVVAQNQMLFASDWLVQNPNTPLEVFCYQKEKPENNNNGKQGFPAQVFFDGPTLRREATPQFLCTLIQQAKSHLVISTPYFVPDYSLINTLCATAYRGVSVVMIFPKRNDSFVVEATSRSYYDKLLKAGVQIFEFRDGLLHAKTLTIDDEITLIGSTNLDLRSFDLNYENNILFNDRSLTKSVFARQMSYINCSDEVTLADVKAWSLPKRIWYNVVATIGPIL